MNKNIYLGFYIILIISIFFILIVSLNLIKKYYKLENFQNNCPLFFKGNTFCQLNKNNNKCECKYQKVGINYPFMAPESCCNNKCNLLSPSECQEKNPIEKTSYFCNIGGKCIEYKGTNQNINISQNNCGLDPLNNQLILPYTSMQECESQNNPCNKYNNYKWSTAKKKSKCLKNVNCGFCTNSYGEGKCIDGNATGPNDILKYFYCIPGVSKNNTYTYGDHALYIL